MGRLVSLLQQLEADQATGRVVVLVKTAPQLRGWVYVDAGRVYCAERSDRPTLLVAMAESGLFGQDAWRDALHAPAGSARWTVLSRVAGIDQAELVDFTRRYVADVLSSLDEVDGELAFGPRVAHPFGRLGAWSADELVGDEDDDGYDDAAEQRTFVELLLEASPDARLISGSHRPPAVASARGLRHRGPLPTAR